jgi:ATP10 protein
VNAKGHEVKLRGHGDKIFSVRCVGPSLRLSGLGGFQGERGIVLKSYLAFPVMLLVAACLSAQVIPHTEAETLSGKTIVLPDAATGHPVVFIVGFSRAGGDSSGRWGKQLRQEFTTDSNVQIYSVAELQDAPKMVRGMIRHSMRGNIPQSEQDTFVVLSQDEDVWKKLADFSDPNDAYILLVDSAGRIRWRTHGKVPDQRAVNALRNEIGKNSEP